MANEISINKIIADIKATKGNRSGCQGLHSSLESDGYITSICKWAHATSPARIDALVTEVEKLRAERDASLNAERAWEKTMMEVCGEDGPASVASEIRALKALRDTAMQALKSQVEQLAAENVGLKQIVDSVTDLSNEPQYHDEGMGCGLEDRGITDRYDACRYGWDKAMERVYGEVIPCAEELDFSATAAYMAGIKADGVDEMASTYRGFANEDGCSVNMRCSYNLTAERAESYAAYIRRQMSEGAK